MRKLPILLICFSIFIFSGLFSTNLYSQSASISAHPFPVSAKKSFPKENPMLDWELDLEQKRKNLNDRLNTIPIFQNSHIHLYLGPAQFQIRIPLS